jgi:uncharacterized surface protein with fasciclin (FAS1) repeats
MVSLIPITKSRSLDYEFNAYDNQKATINYIDNFNDTNTIFHFLKSLRNTRKFFDILSVSKLEYEYTDTILRKTLFVVPDEFFNNEIYESIVENNDIQLARAIIKYHTLSYKVSYEDIYNSNGYFIKSDYDTDRNIKVDTNRNKIILNKNTTILIGDIEIGNAKCIKNCYIHMIDSLLLPSVLL